MLSDLRVVVPLLEKFPATVRDAAFSIDKLAPVFNVILFISLLSVITTWLGLEMVKLLEEVRLVSHASDDLPPGVPYSLKDPCQLAP